MSDYQFEMLMWRIKDVGNAICGVVCLCVGGFHPAGSWQQVFHAIAGFVLLFLRTGKPKNPINP